MWPKVSFQYQIFDPRRSLSLGLRSKLKISSMLLRFWYFRGKVRSRDSIQSVCGQMKHQVFAIENYINLTNGMSKCAGVWYIFFWSLRLVESYKEYIIRGKIRRQDVVLHCYPLSRKRTLLLPTKKGLLLFSDHTVQHILKREKLLLKSVPQCSAPCTMVDLQDRLP